MEIKQMRMLLIVFTKNHSVLLPPLSLMRMMFFSSLSAHIQTHFKNINRGLLFSPTLLTRTPLILVSLVLTSTCLCACGDDTNGLRNTLSSLCSINSEGEFGSCCSTHNTASVNLNEKSTWDCFLRDIGTDSDMNVTSLFVVFFSFSHFQAHT